MCGVAGVLQLRYTSGKDRSTVLPVLLEAIKHRGPDTGSSYTNNTNMDIGAVRLAMVDNKSQSALLSSEDGLLQLAYNGEIYNHKELRAELTRKGYLFKTDNDGEVIIHMYKEYGIAFLNRLDGMFAFALWDDAEKSLMLARDRIGIKPLYYMITDYEIVFASELKAIIKAYPDHAQIDQKSLANYFAYRFIPAPKTIYSGIAKLEPGSFIICQADEVEHGKYWEPKFDVQRSKKKFKNIIHEAIRTTSSSDHRLGVFLSGGLDSSSILAAHSRQEHTPSFTVGYNNAPAEDEESYASYLAAHYKSEHFYSIVAESDVADLMHKTVLSLDEPLYSTVSISNYVVAKAAASHVKGVLTGDGSDELLLGYTYLLPVLDAYNNDLDWVEKYRQQIGWLTESWQKLLIQDTLPVSDKSLITSYDNAQSLNSVRYFELAYRLPEYHLSRMDRLTMAHGLEARVPFLRNEVVDWALSQSIEQLLVPGRQKQVLKDAFADELPTRILDRNKQPFTAPYVAWLKGPLKEEVFTLLKNRNYCNALHIKNSGLCVLLSNCYEGDESAFGVLWGIFILFKWYDNSRN